MAKRKCKKCGRQFEAGAGGDGYCSAPCRMAGYFVGGGGDTTKPGVVAKPEAAIPAARVARVKKDDERFSRVREMFDLPVGERWAVAKDFTEDERAYARRLARRKLMEEERLVREWSWEEEEEDVSDGGMDDGALGDSDDGTI